MTDRPPGARPAARRAHAHRPVARQQRRRSTSTPRRPSSAASPRSRSPTTSTSSPAPRRSRYSTFADRERIVRDAAERWGPQGVAIRFGVELTYDRSWEADIRDHLARPRLRLHDRLGPRPGRLAVQPARTWRPGSRAARWPRSSRPSFDEVDGRRPVRPVRRHRPHRRRQALSLPARPAGGVRGGARAVRADPAGARRERHGPRGQHQRPALRDRRDVPAPGDRGPLPRARWPGRSPSARTPTGPSTFDWGLGDGYAIAATAGFTDLTFRRGPGTDRVSVPLPVPLSAPRIRTDLGLGWSDHESRA